MPALPDTVAVFLNRQWQKLPASIMEKAEDREWAQKAQQAEAEGTIGAEKSAELMRELREKYGGGNDGENHTQKY